MLHSKDDIYDSKLEHMGTIDENLTDVFDLGDPEKFAMEVNQIFSQQGLSPKGSLLKSMKGTKQNLTSRTDHTARPFTRSYSHKTAK